MLCMSLLSNLLGVRLELVVTSCLRSLNLLPN